MSINFEQTKHMAKLEGDRQAYRTLENYYDQHNAIVQNANLRILDLNERFKALKEEFDRTVAERDFSREECLKCRKEMSELSKSRYATGGSQENTVNPLLSSASSPVAKPSAPSLSAS